MNLKKARITNRLEACNCGCQGKDSWHSRDFNRTIHDVRICDKIVKVKAYKREENHAIREGEVRFPWGIETVYEINITEENFAKIPVGYVLGWFRGEEIEPVVLTMTEWI